MMRNRIVLSVVSATIITVLTAWWAVDHCHQDRRRIVNGSPIHYLYVVAAPRFIARFPTRFVEPTPRARGNYQQPGDVRPGIHRARHPPDAHRRHHRPPDGRVDGAAG